MTDTNQSEVRATAAALEALDMDGVADLVRRQYAELETLRAGYDAARLEIESLKAQMQTSISGSALRMKVKDIQ